MKKTSYIEPTGTRNAVHPERVAYEERLAEVRASLQGMEEAIAGLIKDPIFVGVEDAEDGRNLDAAQSNVMLAYRHVEDARMRLGKVFQALNDGKSILPR